MLTIGVDVHKRVHAAAAVDGLGREVEQWRGPNPPAGVQTLTAWASALAPERQWGIEGAWQSGRDWPNSWWPMAMRWSMSMYS